MQSTGGVDGPDGCDAVSISVENRVEALLATASSAAERPCEASLADRVCLFAYGSCVPACMAISDMADALDIGPIHTVCDGRIPGWVDSDVDAVIVSHGDDPEAIPLYDSLSHLGCRVSCISCEGILSERCRSDGGTAIIIDAVSDSSRNVMAALGSLCALLSSMGIIDARSLLHGAVDAVRSGHVLGDPIFEIGSEDVFGVYSTTDVRACSRRWADLLQERAGRLAFCGELPEYDHNELVGWSDPNPHAGQLRMLVLRSEPDGSMPSIIVGHMLEVLSENGREVTVVGIGSGSPLTRDIRGFIEGDLRVRRSDL